MKYSVFELYVIKTEDAAFICKYNELKNKYTEIFTRKKVPIIDSMEIIGLNKYFSMLEVCNYQTGKPLMLSKNDLYDFYANTFGQIQNNSDENIFESLVSNIVEEDAFTGKRR